MNKPTGYDEVQEFGTGNSLPKGGYVCKIVKVEEGKSKNGNDTVYIYLDIAEGEYAGYFLERYKKQTDPATAKWPCVYSQIVLDTTTKQASKGFKTFITSCEKSNAGFVAAQIWGDRFASFFKGRMIGVVFRDTWFPGNNGKPARYAKAAYLCSTETIKKGQFTIPEDDKSQLTNIGNSFDIPGNIGFDSFAPADNVSEDDLPF